MSGLRVRSLPALSPRQALWAVRFFALFLILLHLAAPYLPEEQSWGIFPFTYWPRWLEWLAAGAGALLCVPRANAVVRAALGWLGRRVPARPGRRWWFAGFSLALAPVFWAGRLVHTRWGDAYILVNAIAHPEVRLTYTWQAPLDLFLHAKAWALANRWWGWDVMQTYQALSVAAGVVFVFLLLCMADEMGRSPAEKALFAGWLGTLGLMQFFFGYVENYVWMTIGILAYLWLGMRAAEGRNDIFWPAGVLGLTHAFHPSTILGLEASLAWLWRRRWIEERGLRRRLAMTLRVALPMLVILAGVVVLMEAGGHGIQALLGEDAPGGGDHRWFVPLTQTATRWERYTMFSWGHFLDWTNEQLLVAPFSLALVLIALTTRAGRRTLRGPAGRFLAVAALNYLLFISVWNPDYGGRRDWDLFAPAALPLTLLAAYLWRDMAEPAGKPSGDMPVLSQAELAEAALMVAGVSAIFTAAWVYSNTIPWSWPGT